MPERYFIIVGEKYFHQFKQFPPKVKYLGHITNMKEFYEQVKLLLVPSIVEEGFPRVILEAAINGIPVMANQVGGIPEAVDDSGILIDIDLSKKLNVDEIADKYIFEINRLLNNDHIYAQYSKKARLRAEKYKTEQDKMSKYIYENS
jgi:glycosyltransferase involved in cell wall biosynthesis